MNKKILAVSCLVVGLFPAYASASQCLPVPVDGRWEAPIAAEGLTYFFDIKTPCLDDSRMVCDEESCTSTSGVKLGPTTVNVWWWNGERWLESQTQTAAKASDGSYSVRDFQSGGTRLWFYRVGENLEVTSQTFGTVRKTIFSRSSR